MCRLFLLVALALSGCHERREVIVFHATSLTRAFGELKEVFEREHPALRVRLEPSGSVVAARKLTELGLRADVVAVADAAINQKMLVPALAPWTLRFASNALVLAHLEHSRFTDEITAQNWPEVLLRDGVRLARVDGDLAPLGYHTLLSWQLAEKALDRPGLAAALESRASRVVPDEAELEALLEARAIDYAFLFRSTAEDHRLKVIALPDAVNLSSRARAQTYATARVEVRLKMGADRVPVTGAPILYGLSVPTAAPNPDGALDFVELLLSDQGRRALLRGGFVPLEAADCVSACTLSARLQARLAAPR